MTLPHRRAKDMTLSDTGDLTLTWQVRAANGGPGWPWKNRLGRTRAGSALRPNVHLPGALHESVRVDKVSGGVHGVVVGPSLEKSDTNKRYYLQSSRRFSRFPFRHCTVTLMVTWRTCTHYHDHITIVRSKVIFSHLGWLPVHGEENVNHEEGEEDEKCNKKIFWPSVHNPGPMKRMSNASSLQG